MIRLDQPAPASPEDRRRVMARVGHLVRRKQIEIERAARLLRVHFVARRRRAPKRGTLHRLMLVGVHAERCEVPDRETGEINEYDIWAFVDHPAYRGMNRSWGLARRVVASSLRGRATITLGVFTVDEIARLYARWAIAISSTATSMASSSTIAMGTSRASPMGDDTTAPAPPSGVDLACVAEAIDMLPCLTRTVFLLHRWDGHSYEEVAIRCGISTDEVEHRMVAALFTIRRCCEGDRMMGGRLRLAMRPWRIAWFAWHRRRRDRSLGL